MKNSELILASALRYALGRQTYIVHVVQDEIVRQWDTLSPQARSTIVVDITDYLMDTAHLYDEDLHQARQWAQLGKSLYDSLPDDDKVYVRDRLSFKLNSPFPY
jgi:hypothetical protein